MDVVALGCIPAGHAENTSVNHYAIITEIYTTNRGHERGLRVYCDHKVLLELGFTCIRGT